MKLERLLVVMPCTNIVKIKNYLTDETYITNSVQNIMDSELWYMPHELRKYEVYNVGINENSNILEIKVLKY